MYKCPECGQTESTFTVGAVAYITAIVTSESDIIETNEGDIEWEHDNYMSCDECGHEGTEYIFCEENQEGYIPKAGFIQRQRIELGHAEFPEKDFVKETLGESKSLYELTVEEANAIIEKIGEAKKEKGECKSIW
jgi:hypothetical protein